MNINRAKHALNTLKNAGISTSFRLLRNELKRKMAVSGKMRDLPQKLQLEISNMCNIDCVYCKLRENMPDKSIMSQTTFETVIPYVKYLRSISFCGNAEALVNKNVSSFLRQIKNESKDIYISVFTNAELLTEKHCREFINYGLDSLVFSIDGVDPEIVDKFRKRGSVEKVIKNITMLQRIKEEMKSRNPIVSATLVMYKSNYQQIPEVLRLLKKMDVWRLNANGLEPYSEDLIDEAMWNDPNMYPDILKVLKNSANLANELGIEFLVANLIPQKANCIETDNPTILANGDVVPCSVLAYPRQGYYSVTEDNCLSRVENDKKQVIFGNVNEKNFHEIWNDPDYVDFRSKVVGKEFPGVCKNCLVKHEFICVRPEWSLQGSLNELEKYTPAEITG